MKIVLHRPETIFLFLALAFGFAFIALTPPAGGYDENFHYQRIAALAYGHLLEKESAVPAGLVTFPQKAYDIVSGNAPHHHVYTRADYQALAAIPLSANEPGTLKLNYFTIHNPLPYLPQALAFRAGAAFGLSPLALLYIARIAGLLASVALTYAALCRMPSHRYLLAALALLPTAVFLRSLAHDDGITNGIAFWFIAEIFRAATRDEKPPIARLAALGFALAQCKSGYVLLPLLALAVPPARFASGKAWLQSVALIALPGMFASAAWVLWAKHLYFAGEHYHTWGGDAYPDAQMQLILHHPLTFLNTLLHGMLLESPPVKLLSIIGILGWTDIALPQWGYWAVILGALSLAMSDATANKAVYNRTVRVLAAALFLASFALILSMLYVQWTGLGAPSVQGFQGRYFFPLLPLLLIFVKPLQGAQMAKWAGPALWFTAGAGLGAALWALSVHYFG